MPDTITVTAESAVEVAASHADVVVSVTGSSSFGADQALAKAREVSSLAAELARAGIATDRIEVLSVSSTARTGRLGRHSEATYQLRIRTATVAQVADVIEVVGAASNAGVDGIRWRYPDREGADVALTEAITRARERAEVVATGLGVRLLQVRSFSEHSYDEDHAPMPRVAAMAAEAFAGPTLDLDIGHRKTVRCRVEVCYRIGS